MTWAWPTPFQETLLPRSVGRGGGHASSPRVLTVSETAALVLMQIKPMKSTLLCLPLTDPSSTFGSGDGSPSGLEDREGLLAASAVAALGLAEEKTLSSSCSCHPGNRSVLGENHSLQELKAKNSVGAATLALRSLLACGREPSKNSQLGAGGHCFLEPRKTRLMRGDRAPFSVSRCFWGIGERVGTGEGSEEDSSLRWGETQSCMPPLSAQLKNCP